MTTLEQGRQILDTMLGYLGFVVQIEEDDGPEGPTLQILTEEPDALIGRRGEVSIPPGKAVRFKPGK